MPARVDSSHPQRQGHGVVARALHPRKARWRRSEAHRSRRPAILGFRNRKRTQGVRVTNRACQGIDSVGIRDRPMVRLAHRRRIRSTPKLCDDMDDRFPALSKAAVHSVNCPSPRLVRLTVVDQVVVPTASVHPEPMVDALSPAWLVPDRVYLDIDRGYARRGRACIRSTAPEGRRRARKPIQRVRALGNSPAG